MSKGIDWTSVGKKIASAGAGLLGSAIAGPGAGAGLGAIVADVLGVENRPDSISQAIDHDPQAAVKLQQIQSEERVRLKEILSSQIVAEIQAETANIAQVNATMQAELKASDNYRARWRPTFGYVMAFDMLAISVAFVAAMVAIIVQPENAASIADGFSLMLGSFVTIFSVGLGVLGIQVHNRSRDKRLAAGVDKPGLLEKVGGMFRGNQ